MGMIIIKINGEARTRELFHQLADGLCKSNDTYWIVSDEDEDDILGIVIDIAQEVY